MAITKVDIFKAADEIKAWGKSPTLAAIRKKVGGGSFTTISEAVKEWRDASAPKAPIQTPAPESIKGRLDDLGLELWSAALALANERLACERSGLEAARVEFEAASIEAAELADQLAIELDAEREKSAAARIEAETRLGALQSRLDEALRGQSDAITEAGKSEAKLGEMAFRLNDAKEAAARDAKARDEELERHEATRKKLADAEATLAGFSAELAETRQAAQAAGKELASLRQSVSDMASKLAVADANAEHARELANERAAELDRLRKQVDELAGALKAITQPARLAKQGKAA